MRLSTLTRIAQLAFQLGRGASISTSEIRRRYKVSHSTASRDLVQLEIALPVRCNLWRRGQCKTLRANHAS